MERTDDPFQLCGKLIRRDFPLGVQRRKLSSMHQAPLIHDDRGCAELSGKARNSFQNDLLRIRTSTPQSHDDQEEDGPKHEDFPHLG